MALGEAASAAGSWLSGLLRRLSGLGRAAPGAELPTDSGIDKQALRDVIERKRHHDQVREREFDHLRQLRRRNLDHGAQALQAAASRFETSILTYPQERAPSERASTLRKIDEIEARLSRQWWRDAPPAGVRPGLRRLPPAPTTAPAPDTLPPALTATTAPGFAATRGEAPTLLPVDAPGTQPPAATPAPAAHRPTAGPAFPTRTAQTTGAPLDDPELQEAALCLVHDDRAGAEAILRRALQTAPDAGPALHGLWLGGLLALLHTSGRAAEFDALRREFGTRWPQPDWRSPARLGPPALAQLEQTAAAGQALWLDWSSLDEVAPQALETLARLLTRWSEAPLRLRWRGHARLGQVLRSLTPPGGRETGQAAWLARLQALRLMGLRDEFELVALEYCTTFAATPPPWQPPRCTCVPDADPGAAWAEAPAVELAGDLALSLRERLATWPAEPTATPRLRIVCAGLTRLDFQAAGSLHHWLQTYRSRGGQAQLQEVSPLVAGFMQLVGLNELAQIVPRDL